MMRVMWFLWYYTVMKIYSCIANLTHFMRLFDIIVIAQLWFRAKLLFNGARLHQKEKFSSFPPFPSLRSLLTPFAVPVTHIAITISIIIILSHQGSATDGVRAWQFSRLVDT